MQTQSPDALPELPRPSSFDYRSLYYLFREQAWVIALCLLVALLATATILMRSPRVYAAATVLLVKMEDAKVVDIQQIQQDEYQSLESLKTVEQRLRSRILIERVIDANHLAEDPRIVPRTGELTREQLVSRVSGMVDVRLRRGTRLVDITVENTDPALAALIANSLVTEFVRQDYEQDSASLRAANQFLEPQAAVIKEKLDASENALQLYKERTHAVSSADAQNIVVQELDALNAKATEAKSHRIACETAFRETQALGGDVNGLLLTPAADLSDAIKECQSNIVKAESDLADLKPRYKPKHPKYLEAESRLAQWQKALNQAALELPQSARAAYESAVAAETALDDALRKQQAAALELNRKAIRYDELQRDVDSNRSLYETITNQIKNNAVTQDIKASNIRVVEPAEVPEKPIKPDALKVISAGLACGLLGSVVLAFLMNGLDQSLKTVDQAEKALQLPVLCTIPKFNPSAADTVSNQMEAFRTLRASLETLDRRGERKVFLFTSSLPEEGKTFCSLNYAASLARQGFATLLIDGDLRRPMIERIMAGRKRDRNCGLIDYLTTQNTFDQIIHGTDTENLFYIPVGSRESHPVELLAHGGFDALVREALVRFDRVVIDSAPVHVVSDALLLLRPVQAVCLVIGANRTSRASVRRTAEVLRQAGAPVLGSVLNFVTARANGEAYYDYTYRRQYAESKT